MAAALLQKRCDELKVDAHVQSAGTRATSGMPPTDEAIAAVAALDCDVAGHRSRTLDPADIAAADVIVTMAREHVRDLVVKHRDAWTRTFTLREVVRRADEIGARDEGNEESLRAWAGRLGALRSTASLLDESQDDDIPDPIGRPASFYADTAATLDDLITRFVRAAWPARITDSLR